MKNKIEIDKIVEFAKNIVRSCELLCELMQEFEPVHDSIAKYKITVNESKLVLTDGSPLVIHDVMSDSLAFISGSLVITAEDGAGNITTLQQGTD